MISKPPLPDNELARLSSLQEYGLMDSGEDKEFDDIASIASAVCGIPISLITFIDEKRQYFKSHIGTDFTENLRELSFCTHAIASGEEIMIVPDARVDERFNNNPMVTGPTALVFYAGVPLINQSGFAMGTICVLDQKTHILNAQQVSALKSLARQVVDKIELRRNNLELLKSNQELLNSNVLIQKFASMAAHDIKNPLTGMLLTSQLLKSTIGTLGDERANKLLEVNISSTKSLLSLVDEMLEYSKAPELLIARKQQIMVSGLFERLKNLVPMPPGFSLQFFSSCAEIYHSSIALEQILLNLLTNAVRYNDKEIGLIKVSIREDEHAVVLEVEDNGNGVRPEFQAKIFEANFVGASADRFSNSGTGIGLSTVKDLITRLEGKIFLESSPGEGSVFIVQLPKYSTQLS